MKKFGETPWTAEQTETMTRLWNSGLSASLIAPQVGFSRGAVLGKLNRLGLLNRRPTTMPTVRTSRLWPEENVALLRRLYAEGEPFEKIALACGVSKASVRNKAQNLGLRRRAIRTRWTDERVDQLRRLWIEGKTAAEAARALALPVGPVKNKIQLLRLRLPIRPKEPKPPRKTMRWTDEKVAKLRRLWLKGKTAKEVALALGATTYAVQQRIHILKLVRRRPRVARQGLREARLSP
jgi:hypothetical protein